MKKPPAPDEEDEAPGDDFPEGWTPPIDPYDLPAGLDKRAQLEWVFAHLPASAAFGHVAELIQAAWEDEEVKQSDAAMALLYIVHDVVMMGPSAPYRERLRRMASLVASAMATGGRDSKATRAKKHAVFIQRVKAAHPNYSPAKVRSEVVLLWNEAHPKAKPLTIRALIESLAHLENEPEKGGS